MVLCMGTTCTTPTADRAVPDVRADLSRWSYAQPDLDVFAAAQLSGEELETWPPVDSHTLLAWAEESEPIFAAGLLRQIVPTDLDDEERVRLIAQWGRVESSVTAMKLAAVGAFAGPRPQDQPDDRRNEPDFTDLSVGVTLRLSSLAGGRLVGVARVLADRLPGTRRLLAEGRLGYLHVLSIAEGVEDLTPEQAARLEELVLPRAADQTPGQIRLAVKKALARIAPDRLRERERAARGFTGVDTTQEDDGTGTAFVRGPSIGIQLIETWVETFARTAKAAGDERSLEMLRFVGLVAAAEAALNGSVAGSPSTEHGRPLCLNLAVDLPTFLGLTDHPVEILGTGQLIPAEALADILPGAQLRRIITDPMTGELLDYGRTTYRVPPDLSGFTTARDVTSTGPGSTVPAGRGDKDHARAFEQGGRTDRDNVHSPNRRWHRAKTIGGWTVRQQADRSWRWHGPRGEVATTRPHDYRLGP